MSHITVVECAVKFDDKATLKATLEMLKNQFPGLTYVESPNGKIIQVVYDKLDNPVRSYHPDGNLRFTLKSDGTYEMSGDAYACREDYKKVCDAVNVNYQQIIATEHGVNEGYSVTEDVDEKGQVVLYLREY
jgi:hypothetical protein